MEFTWYGRSSSGYCSPRMINNYSFIFVESGYGSLKIGQDSYNIEPNDLLILYPDLIHQYGTNPGENWSLIWFGVSGKDITDLIRQAGLKKNSPIIKGIYNHVIPDIIREILLLLDENRMDYNIFAMGKFLTLLGHLYIHLTDGQNIDSSPKQRIQNIIHFMKHNFIFNIDTDTLAKQAGYTRTYFSTLFKELTGKTPIEYLIEIRLENACRLLRETNLTIKEISNSSGYNDSLYFTKVFKKHYGLNPSQLKKGSSNMLLKDIL